MLETSSSDKDKQKTPDQVYGSNRIIGLEGLILNMTNQFVNATPVDIMEPPVFISGIGSSDYLGSTYLLITEEHRQRVFGIHYEYQVGPFQEVLLIEDILVVGYQEHCYLFDKANNKSLLVLKLEGYFGHLYYDQDVFVTDAGGVDRMDRSGTIIWRNNNLGVDGVVIKKITEHTIHGSGDWDPPGDWRNFILVRATGLPTRDARTT